MSGILLISEGLDWLPVAVPDPTPIAGYVLGS